MRFGDLAIVFAACSLLAEDARAEPDFPCKGCVVVAPKTDDGPRPLLVVLHGDEGSPTKVLGAWKQAADAAGVVLFAPRCPTSEGCNGSWWRWDGDPEWLLAQVALVEARHPIDPKRRYLAGWSGGTTYASFHIPRWSPTFAAVSLAGGGAPPHDETCLPHAGGACEPIHYLQGDKNPLFAYAEGAHAYLEKCGHAVTWELHAGADHAGEWRAYERETGTILGWLLARPEGCVTASVPATPAPATSAPSEGEAPLSGPSAASAPSAPSSASAPGGPGSPPASLPSGPRCSCTFDASSGDTGAVYVALALGLTSRRSWPRRPARTWFRRRASS